MTRKTAISGHTSRARLCSLTLSNEMDPKIEGTWHAMHPSVWFLAAISIDRAGCTANPKRCIPSQFIDFQLAAWSACGQRMYRFGESNQTSAGKPRPVGSRQMGRVGLTLESHPLKSCGISLSSFGAQIKRPNNWCALVCLSAAFRRSLKSDPAPFPLDFNKGNGTSGKAALVIFSRRNMQLQSLSRKLEHQSLIGFSKICIKYRNLMSFWLQHAAERSANIRSIKSRGCSLRKWGVQILKFPKKSLIFSDFSKFFFGVRGFYKWKRI